MSKRRVRLQKLFSAFPDGRPGFGLLLLRGLLSATVVAQTIATIIVASNLSVVNLSIAAIAFVVAGCLLVGFFTPFIAAIIGLGAIGFTLLGLPLPIQHPLDPLLDTIVLSVVILLVGPGAFSFDARRFGRREIRIPVASPPVTK